MLARSSMRISMCYTGIDYEYSIYKKRQLYRTKKNICTKYVYVYRIGCSLEKYILSHFIYI